MSLPQLLGVSFLWPFIKGAFVALVFMAWLSGAPINSHFFLSSVALFALLLLPGEAVATREPRLLGSQCYCTCGSLSIHVRSPTCPICQ